MNHVILAIFLAAIALLIGFCKGISMEGKKTEDTKSKLDYIKGKCQKEGEDECH